MQQHRAAAAPCRPRSAVPCASIALVLSACGGGGDGIDASRSVYEPPGDIDASAPGRPIEADALEASDDAALVSDLGSGLVGDIRRWGIVQIRNEYLVGGRAAFYEADPSRVDYRDVFGRYRLADDTCVVEPDLYSQDWVVWLTEPFENDAVAGFDYAPRIDAGDVITLAGADGVFGRWDRSAMNEGYRLLHTGATREDVADIVFSPAPAGLVLNVPGGEFPAFSNVAVPYVDAGTELDEPFEPERPVTRTLSWAAGTNPDARISIVDRVRDAAGRDHWVRCMAIDDGAFDFPESVLETLGRDAVVVHGADVDRVAFTIERQGDAALIVMSWAGRL